MSGYLLSVSLWSVTGMDFVGLKHFQEQQTFRYLALGDVGYGNGLNYTAAKLKLIAEAFICLNH